MQQELPSNSSQNSGNSPINGVMNSANSKKEMAGNREITSPESIRQNKEHRDIRDDYANQCK